MNKAQEEKQCPQCKNKIPKEAVMCPFCKYNLGIVSSNISNFFKTAGIL
jgi:RNA polymerase subunit RPABC4/transcription elongation factor Spt4